MTKKSFFAALAATLLISLFSVSCQPKDDDSTPDEPTLSLSVTALTFDKSATTNQGAQQVAVTTNQPKFTVSTTADWIITEVNGNNIKVSTLSNDLGRERKGDVLVFAGGLVEKVVVTQSAADILLEVSPEKKVVTNKGEEFLVSIRSNGSTWTIDNTTYDWMKVEKFTSELIKIVVAPNNSPEPREGKLYAKSGNATKEILITQVGVGSEDSKFFLPLLKKSPTSFEILDYEAKLGNYLLIYNQANPSWGENNDIYIFACSSKVFFSTIYEVDITRNALNQIFMRSYDAAALKSQEFKDFLVEKGFKIDDNVTETGFSAFRESDNLSAKVIIAPTADRESFVQLKYVPIQPKPFPTFAKFPYDKTIVIDNPDWAAAKIIEDETKNGSRIETIMAPDFPELYLQISAYPKKEGRETPHKRGYFIDTDPDEGTSTGLTSEMMVIWEDYTLGVWKEGESMFLTKEFKNLMQSEGFAFLQENSKYQFYYNKAKSLVIVPRGAKFRDLFDGQPCFVMNYFKMSGEDTSLSDPIKRNILIEKMSQAIDAKGSVYKK